MECRAAGQELLDTHDRTGQPRARRVEVTAPRRSRC
jgi:hypothetical protein